WTLLLVLSFPGLIVAGKKYLWKTPIRSFRRLAIANRITPHGRRGPRLQRAVSARNRVDWEALDGGRRQGTHSRACSLQPIALGRPWNQRSRPDRKTSRARVRRARGKACRPGTAGACELSTHLAWARARAGAGGCFAMGGELARDVGRRRRLRSAAQSSLPPPCRPSPASTPRSSLRFEKITHHPAC